MNWLKRLLPITDPQLRRQKKVQRRRGRQARARERQLRRQRGDSTRNTKFFTRGGPVAVVW
ncbi:hypothetical protein AFCA_008918 [Aspergillus flavus]|nr:hypothetical protein AFCA_008918 [Aspergillus flavus]